MRDSQFQLRHIASALFGIPGCDATPAQIQLARRAATYYKEGKSMGMIFLLLRIKPPAKMPTRLPLDREEDRDLVPEPISLHSR